MADVYETETQTCCICGGDIESVGTWMHGHNAEPVVPGGRCCAFCNASFVIPQRFAAIVLPK